MSPVDWFWKVFESSGSLDAYLLYRNFQETFKNDDQVKGKLSFKGGAAID